MWAFESENGKGLSSFLFFLFLQELGDWEVMDGADISRWSAGVGGGAAEEGRREGKCSKCRITVFSKPQLRVKMKWVYHLTT